MNEHDAIARIKRLSHSINCADEIAEVIERLIKERDEARWEVCGFHHLTGFLAGDYAISRGWNYLNDERKWSEFRPSVKEFEAYLKGQEQVWLEIIENKNKRIKELEGLIDSAMEADYNNEYFRTHHK